MNIYIGGEDDVTRAIAKRLVYHCFDNDNDCNFIMVAPRDNGAKALKNINKMVILGENQPVVGVFDCDEGCVIDFLERNTENGWKSQYSAINIAIDEAESWLFADRNGFAKFLKVNTNVMPKLAKNENEISNSIRYKPSLFLTREIAPLSKSKTIREEFRSPGGNRKPVTYNNIILPFINKYWNIDEALINSSSLNRTVNRINTIISSYKSGIMMCDPKHEIGVQL